MIGLSNGVLFMLYYALNFVLMNPFLLIIRIFNMVNNCDTQFYAPVIRQNISNLIDYKKFPVRLW
jgi:hypothetical protein